MFRQHAPTLALCLVLCASIALARTQLPPAHQATFERLQLCEANGSSWVGGYDEASYNPRKAMAALREEDGDSMGVDCTQGRRYSHSLDEGKALLIDHLTNSREWTRSCFIDEQGMSETEYEDLIDGTKSLVNDSTIGVFASLYTEANDNSEGCAYFTFDLYRTDGVKVHLTFNFTD